MLSEETIQGQRPEIQDRLSPLILPAAPESEAGSVKVWSQRVIMMTYAPAQPDKNPLFLEKRVYQGSSGRVYPLPVIDLIATKPEPRHWDAIHLENEYLRLMVMPEIGGRIHIGMDKRTGYDFFYRQNVIKPALVGLAGPWISGGVEFNWPQHHRPATFMPVETSIERAPDGSVTVWCSDHDPMSHLRGMHGVCLRPGSAVVEVRVRLYNRTQDTQTFLWWANVATRVHEQYQSFFPGDVRFVADHAKRAMTEYPLSHGLYYGVDYKRRSLEGIPADEMPPCFIPDGSYLPNDLGWYANIPVPTSYMIVDSKGDFFGGYDHKQKAGTVAVANHHVAPGKKQWTWGNHEFGYAWDRSLTNEDGPYVELMSGAYTDNQPDFSFLAPGETKTFSQFWYPIGDIGVPNLASVDGALRVEVGTGEITVHVQVTAPRQRSNVIVRAAGGEVGRWTGDLMPEKTWLERFRYGGVSGGLEVIVQSDDATLLRYAPDEITPVEAPNVATEPPLPKDVHSMDELFLIGVHLEQYRHPTRNPEVYWQEALSRDPDDSRCNHMLGRWHLRRGEFEQAERYLRAAIARLTMRNPNPYDGEPHYNLGLTLRYQDRVAEAYDAFYKSTWNAAWRGPGYHRLAEIDCVRGEWLKALDHLDCSLVADADNLSARNLKAVVLERLGRKEEAQRLLQETRALDPLDLFSRFLIDHEVPTNPQMQLDLGFDLMRSGLLGEALDVFETPGDVPSAMVTYARADVLRQMGRGFESIEAYRQASQENSDYIFPNRLEELRVLEKALEIDAQDARAAYALGNLLYDRRRHREAIVRWEQSVSAEPEFSIAWRNLGIAYFNVLSDSRKALNAFERARTCAPTDARLLYEQDQLRKRTGFALEERLELLRENRPLVDSRDDLSVEFASLLNSLGRPEEALLILRKRQFQPWEGGEGLVLSEYVRANVLLAQNALPTHSQEALEFLHAASSPPCNLSEAKHLLMNLSLVDYWYGVAYTAIHRPEEAKRHWLRAASRKGDFQQMQMQPVSEMTYWSAMALRELGREQEAIDLFRQIESYAFQLERQTPKIDYFATSLPAMLLFEVDLKERQTITARFLEAQVALGLGLRERSIQLLRQVEKMDHSHTGTIDMCRLIEGGMCRDQ
jgi:tetratricopeptide (TPR) repeat protein